MMKGSTGVCGNKMKSVNYQTLIGKPMSCGETSVFIYSNCQV